MTGLTLYQILPQFGPDVDCDYINYNFSALTGYLLSGDASAIPYQQIGYGNPFNVLTGNSWFSYDEINGILNIQDAYSRQNTLIGYQAGLGTLTSSTYDSTFIGYQAGASSQSIYWSEMIGYQTGSNSTGITYSQAIGKQALYGANNIYFGAFLGYGTGINSTNVNRSEAFGNFAMQNSNNIIQSSLLGAGSGTYGSYIYGSQFVGFQTAEYATNVYDSQFFGYQAGYNVTQIYNSQFIGYQAGLQSANVNYSIYMGHKSGYATATASPFSGWSILLGAFTKTGGFANSVALGYNVTNTQNNQFYIADNLTNWSIAGLIYNMPAIQANGALTNDGAGNLSWTNKTLILAISAVTTTYNISAANDYTVNCTSGSFSVTLPTAIGIQGQIFVIKNSGVGAITLATTSAQTIDGLTSQTITTLNSLTVQSTGAGWIII